MGREDNASFISFTNHQTEVNKELKARVDDLEEKTSELQRVVEGNNETIAKLEMTQESHERRWLIVEKWAEAEAEIQLEPDNNKRAPGQSLPRREG